MSGFLNGHFSVLNFARDSTCIYIEMIGLINHELTIDEFSNTTLTTNIKNESSFGYNVA